VSESTPATKVLQQAGVPFTLYTYEHSDTLPEGMGYGEFVASQIGLPTDQVYKTLVVDAAGRLAVGILPVDRQVNMKALAATLGAKKARMADRDAAHRATGYVAGGTSPFGQRTALPTVLDASALEQPQIVVSAGLRGLQVAVSAEDLVRLLNATVTDICR
jgi:Cys-tRNA(Pro)/Cys-tRNA(Cys) deacylase